MLFPRWQIRVLRVVVASVFVVAAGWYSPLLIAAGWHLFHPSGRVMYGGLRVLVPWPWVADIDAVKADPTVTPQGLSLRKSGFTLAERDAADVIFVTVVSPDPGVSAIEQTDGWLKIFRASHPGSAFRMLSSSPAPAGASCLKAENPTQQKEQPGGKIVIWTCISMSGGWVANFEGRERNEQVFFEILQQLRRENAGPRRWR